MKLIRSGTLQQFVAAADTAFDHFVRSPDGRRTAARVFHALQVIHPPTSKPGRRLPTCSVLPEALSVGMQHPNARCLLDAFSAIEPELRWQRRESHADGYATAMILGPSGIEERSDVWVGVSLLAPGVRYPDHNHPPEEVYLVLSDGEFRQGDGDWFTPGVGGTFYNPPGIRHAMRSSSLPLLAFWILPID